MAKKETKKKDALDYLRLLQETIGWKIVVRVLEENMKDLDLKLHGQMELEKDDSVEVLQRQWKDRNELKDLPANLIEKYKDAEAFPVELDPFF